MRCSVQRSRDLQVGDAVVYDDVDRLLGEIIDDSQAFQTPPVRQRIHHEINGPNLLGAAGQQQWTSRTFQQVKAGFIWRL